MKRPLLLCLSLLAFLASDKIENHDNHLMAQTRVKDPQLTAETVELVTEQISLPVRPKKLRSKASKKTKTATASQNAKSNPSQDTYEMGPKKGPSGSGAALSLRPKAELKPKTKGQVDIILGETARDVEEKEELKLRTDTTRTDYRLIALQIGL